MAPAERLGRHDIGRILPGAAADIILLDLPAFAASGQNREYARGVKLLLKDGVPVIQNDKIL